MKPAGPAFGVVPRPVVWAGLLLLAPALLAQAPIERKAPPVPTLTVQSRLVSVPINVMDEHGAPVPSLTLDDFTLFEDGQPQKIAIFERDTSAPLSIVLAIDASESVLRDEGLERNAAKHFVKALVRPQDELDLMEFADTVREVVSFTNDPRRIDAGLSEIQRGDATALYDAIYLASQRLGETHPGGSPTRRRVVVLITDGGDTVKGSRYTQALEQAQRAGAMVYSLIIVPVWADAGRNTGGEHALIQMANDTGGKYYYVTEPKDLEPALRHVSDDLRTQYLLAYYAPERTRLEGDRDPSSRTITVKLKDPALEQKCDLRYRKAYYPNLK
ncbi:MAG TPA: VWA domain-containing protein [Granulicella sp.]|jgi:Ca-activated chloride channel family protein|nr:VWA domain-containing protein [Granulicella sp.]